ncbi:hypothetical protein D3C84_749260 [compost metagenome]
MEATAFTCRLLQHDRSAQLADHVLHCVQADTAPGDFSDCVAQTETGQEQERQQLLFTQLRGRIGRGQLALDDAAPDLLQIDAITVIAQLQHQQAGLMGGAQTDQAFLRLAGQQALFRGFDSVIHGVAQQVRQGCFEFLQYITVDLGFLALDLQPHLLAEATTEVANHAYLAGQDIGERPHATGQGSVVQHLRTLAGLPGELIQLGVFFYQ